jgi:hypothetical protein
MPSDALKRIEEKHAPKDRVYSPAEECEICGQDPPCDEVQLARALDAACDALDAWGHHSDAKTFRAELQEIAGEG